MEDLASHGVQCTIKYVFLVTDSYLQITTATNLQYKMTMYGILVKETGSQ